MKNVFFSLIPFRLTNSKRPVNIRFVKFVLITALCLIDRRYLLHYARLLTFSITFSSYSSLSLPPFLLLYLYTIVCNMKSETMSLYIISSFPFVASAWTEKKINICLLIDAAGAGDVACSHFPSSSSPSTEKKKK